MIIVKGFFIKVSLPSCNMLKIQTTTINKAVISKTAIDQGLTAPCANGVKMIRNIRQDSIMMLDVLWVINTFIFFPLGLAGLGSDPNSFGPNSFRLRFFVFLVLFVCVLYVLLFRFLFLRNSGSIDSKNYHGMFSYH